LISFLHTARRYPAISVFGGIINGFAISLCLNVGTTTGGTDFISIYFSHIKGIDTWNYILLGNVVILLIAGGLFGWSIALYSIIYQFCSTQVIQFMYKRYQKMTLFIISDKSEEIYHAIKNTTNHDATLFKGIGCYEEKERTLIYSVIVKITAATQFLLILFNLIIVISPFL